MDVLLSSLTELVQQRLRLKGAKGKRVHVATPTELSVMAEVSEWCSDPKVAQQLLQLLVTVLANNKQLGDGKNGESSTGSVGMNTSVKRGSE